jgi:hypothetical protein
MTGLSGAARQGEKREVLVGAARRFAAAILQEEASRCETPEKTDR